MHTEIESTVMNCHIPVTQLQQLTHSLSRFVCISPHVLPFCVSKLLLHQVVPGHSMFTWFLLSHFQRLPLPSGSGLGLLCGAPFLSMPALRMQTLPVCHPCPKCMLCFCSRKHPALWSPGYFPVSKMSLSPRSQPTCHLFSLKSHERAQCPLIMPHTDISTVG